MKLSFVPKEKKDGILMLGLLLGDGGYDVICVRPTGTDSESVDDRLQPAKHLRGRCLSVWRGLAGIYRVLATY